MSALPSMVPSGARWMLSSLPPRLVLGVQTRPHLASLLAPRQRVSSFPLWIFWVAGCQAPFVVHFSEPLVRPQFWVSQLDGVQIKLPKWFPGSHACWAYVRKYLLTKGKDSAERQLSPLNIHLSHHKRQLTVTSKARPVARHHAGCREKRDQ